MIHTTAYTLLLFCLVVHGASANTAQAADDTMQPIFDGKSLDGWVIEGNKTEGNR